MDALKKKRTEPSGSVLLDTEPDTAHQISTRCSVPAEPDNVPEIEDNVPAVEDDVLYKRRKVIEYSPAVQKRR